MQLTDHCPAASSNSQRPIDVTPQKRHPITDVTDVSPPIPLAQPPRLRPQALKSYNEISSLSLPRQVIASTHIGGVTASTGLLAAERHAGVWTPVIAHKTISAEPQFALAA
jgi:hypothetical protein